MMMSVIKFMFAVVVAVGVAWTAGFVANAAVSAEELETNAYSIEVAEAEAPVSTPAPAMPAITEEAPAEDVMVMAEAETDAAEAPAEEAPAEEAAPAAEMSLVEMIAAADVERGKKLSKACMACHKFEKGGKNMVGPNQWNVVGREKGTVEGFKYSDAIKNLGGTWTYEDLDGYLTNPKKFAPGNKMTYAGVKKAEDRAALIAWLRLQADEPLPLE